METLSGKTSGRNERVQFLFAERIRYVLNDPVSSLITNMALGLVLCFLLEPVFNTGRLFIWIISLFVVCMCRIMIARMYSRYRERFSPRFWFRLYFTGTELSALVWGSTALFLFPEGFVESQLFQVAVLAGLVHGAGHNQAPFQRVHSIYAGTVMGPVIVRFLSLGTFHYQMFALALVFLFAALFLSTRRMHRILMESLDMRYEMSQMALVDSLTGIANRRHFDIFIYQEWRKAQREQTPIAMLMVDVDYFKYYNDIYGHQHGDQCLRSVARTINDVVHRPSDLVARYGGEEFGVILPGTPVKGACKVADEMCRAVENLRIEHRKSTASPYITVSIGVAVMIPGRDDHLNEMVSAADEALYRAKESGRNRICLYREEAGDVVGTIHVIPR